MWQPSVRGGTRAVAGALGSVVVLGVGVAVASMPSGADGPLAAASPVRSIAAEREESPLFTGNRTVLRVRLPRGLYAVNAKVVTRTNVGGTTGCKLAPAGQDAIDHTLQTQPSPITQTTSSTHTLQFAGQLRGVLEIFCVVGGSWRVEMAKITAIRLTGLNKAVL